MAESETEADSWEMEFDFLSNLPPEVVLLITEYLSVCDVLRCMRVCHNWNAMLRLGEFSSFWRRTCKYLGLSEGYVREKMSKTQFPNELFLSVRQHQLHVTKLEPELKVMSGIHPFESTSKCEHAGQGYFVKTVDYSSLKSEETVIGRFCPEKKTVEKIDSLLGSFGEVVWATVCAGNIIWITNRGFWFRYHLETFSFHKMFDRGRVNRSMGDSIGHCNHCFFMVVAGAENTMHGYNWHMHFIRYEKGRENEPAIEKRLKTTIPPGITQFIPRPVMAYFLPDDESCSSHRLLIQGGSGACVFKLEHDGPEGIRLSPKPIGSLNPFYDSEAAVMVVNTTSEITLSRDEKLMGIVTSVVYPFQSGLCLHIFNVNTYERIISHKVDWKDDFNDAEVLAVTRLYTVLGIGHSKGAVKIIQSRTGKVLLEKYGLSRGLPPVIPMARLLLVHFQGVYGEECLTDVLSPLTLVAFYRKGIGNIEGAFFHPFPKTESNVKPSLDELEDSEDADREM